MRKESSMEEFGKSGLIDIAKSLFLGETFEGICDKCGMPVKHFAWREPAETWVLCRECVRRDIEQQARKDVHK
jgi:hypothetical protein